MSNPILSDEELANIELLLWGTDDRKDDKDRWIKEKFQFNNPDVCFGLTQSFGGPCGILSVVQAYIWKYLAFQRIDNISPPFDLYIFLLIINRNATNAIQDLSTSISLCNGFLMSFEEETEESHFHPYFPEIKITQSILLNALSNALNDIIWNTVKFDKEPKVKILIKNSINQNEIHTFVERTESLMLIRSNVNQYMSEDGGVLLFVYSVMLSRGLERIKEDKVYDDALIGMFGNTSVELMNLLLVGYATQNLHDGIKNQDGMLFKGIISQPDIGVLTIHEAFGYQQNGLYLKYPLYPIWIILGETHISVIFSDKIEISRLTKEQLIWKRILYRFKELDTIGSECIEVIDFSKLTELIDPPISSDIVNKCQDFLRKKCEGTLIPFRDIEMLLKPFVYNMSSIEDNIKNYFYFEPEVVQSTNVQSTGEWNCSSCTFKNNSSNLLCEICNSAKPTVWKCRFCSKENIQSDECCISCKQNKHLPLQQYNFVDPEFILNSFNIYYYSTVIPKSGKQSIYKADICRKDPLLRFGTERGINGIIRTKWNECEIKWDPLDGYPDIER